MSAPVDLDNLRSITDGDEEIEKALFEEFFSSSEASLRVMQSSVGPEGNEIWRQQAHAIKGVSLNLGANRLSDLCKKAQDHYQISEIDKRELLTLIQDEYSKVCAYLKNIM